MSEPSLSPETATPALPTISPEATIQFKAEGETFLLTLPPNADDESEVDWLEMWQGFKRQILARRGEWSQNATVDLQAQDRLLDNRQLQTLLETLAEADLKLQRVLTTRRQTAVVAASAGFSVEQQTTQPSLLGDETAADTVAVVEPLYLQTTVRSGVEIRHGGTVILVGDLNPGGIVIATGDICVWGRLRGVAHAGAQGNRASRIMALQMEATQLRIADVVARLPNETPEQWEPEVAHITAEGIRLGRALDFVKTHTFSQTTGTWSESKRLPLMTQSNPLI